MKKKVVLSFVILFISATLLGCSKSTSEFTLGALNDGKYRNGFFGFEMAIDDQYTFLTQEEILGIRSSAIEENEDEQADELELKDQPVVYYLYALKYPMNSENLYNPYIAIYSENLEYLETTVNTKEKYIQYNMDFAKAMLTLSGFNATYTNIDNYWYDDRQFANSTLTMELDGMQTKKELFTILRNNYAITVILGYDKLEDREELVKFLDTIEIDNQ